MTSHWTHQLARALATGRPTTTLESNLDALLLWLSNPDNPRATEVCRAIRRAGLSRRQAAARAYELLDQRLFADSDRPSPRTLGLPPDADPTLAKQRYRRLIQVYHPDRHPTEVAWATHRTERINLAFDAHRRGTNGWPSRSAAADPTDGARAQRESVAPTWIGPAVWSWLIRSLEIAKGFRRRLLAGVALTGLLVIGVVFFSHEPRPVPAPRAIRPSVETLPQPTPRSEPWADTAETPEANSAVAVASQADKAPDTPAESVESDREPARTPVEPRLEPEESSRMTMRSEYADSLEPLPQSRPEPEAGIPETAPTLAEPMVASEMPSPIVAPAELAAPPPAERAHPILRESVATQPSEPPSASTLAGAGSVKRPPDQAREPPRPVPPERLPEPAPPPMPTSPRMTIPSVSPPSAPALPTQPNPPALASLAAPLAPANAPVADTAALDCGAVPELLEKFQRAYEAGALNELMALYSPESRENELVNWLSIRHTYADWFRKTTARRIVFEQLHVQPTANPSRCAAIAIFQVSYLDAQGHLATQANVIEFLFERRGADLYILRVRY
ncbi:DnaJ-class molecular chaperone with C-terminal Zn finger domain [Thiocystis violascens DSM 198]|uniref:DnaJ-class molecular chaperone with C-terminal Zn finger domain n=2 Tax=Thiocystis violascens TaxID=73141 RepID=I3Y786_THIV6|nr:DnaJ-class molecular chaperone with C-terminal Zn finger domain [Thiocystis violascens DSM 198]